MIANQTTTYVLGVPINAIKFITSNYIRLNDGGGVPVGFSIPIPAGSTGLTLVYYSRLVSRQFEQYKIYLSGSGGLAGSGLHANEVSLRGVFYDGYRLNGQPFPYGTRYVYESGQWVQLAVKTTNNTSQRGAGSMYVNLFAGSTSPGDGLPGVDYAYLAVYQREVSDAELSGVLPPPDYQQLYTFAGYQPGDLVLVEQNGTGLDGTLYY